MISVEGLEALKTQGLDDPSRPKNIELGRDFDEALPSSSNRVGLNEFAVGSYKEFKLREELGGLIEKYNKQFYGDAKKP